ncbi:hypothetical protein Tsubulata_036937 [Turnera subulata]|uniref:BHLH domain-containing protein n=1 Tax=Turnera subulata TaxID=218843 RepID=A0A9Q0FNM3_9ROSI|nr:hypothetical protein Tsubulata_036937 [Turnera subulata]
MDEQSGNRNPLELLALNFHGDANDVSYGVGFDSTQQFISLGQNQPHDLSLPRWPHYSSTPQNYFEFFTENPALLGESSTTVKAENMSPPSNSTIFEGLSGIQRDLLLNNPGMACGSELSASSAINDPGYLKSNPYMVNSNNYDYDAPLHLACFKQRNEAEEAHTFGSSQHQNHSQNPTLWTQDASSFSIGNVSESHPRVTVSESVFVPEPHQNVRRQRKSPRNDRQRRKEENEQIRKLQELLPSDKKGKNQTDILGNVFAYIKQLQFQINELVKSGQGGEPTSAPMVYIKERGHFLDDGLRKESLEEMLLKLIEENPSAAVKVFESKGYSVVPIALAAREVVPYGLFLGIGFDVLTLFIVELMTLLATWYFGEQLGILGEQLNLR